MTNYCVTNYCVTWSTIGNKSGSQSFPSESQARNFLLDLTRHPYSTQVVEAVITRVTNEELERWWAPGYPF